MHSRVRLPTKVGFASNGQHGFRNGLRNPTIKNFEGNGESCSSPSDIHSRLADRYEINSWIDPHLASNTHCFRGRATPVLLVRYLQASNRILIMNWPVLACDAR